MPEFSRRIYNRAIGDVIRSLRHKAQLTQATLAAFAGISRTHLIDLERAKHNPIMWNVRKVTGALNITMVDFCEKLETRALKLYERTKRKH